MLNLFPSLRSVHNEVDRSLPWVACRFYHECRRVLKVYLANKMCLLNHFNGTYSSMWLLPKYTNSDLMYELCLTKQDYLSLDTQIEVPHYWPGIIHLPALAKCSLGRQESLCRVSTPRWMGGGSLSGTPSITVVLVTRANTLKITWSVYYVESLFVFLIAVTFLLS